MATDDDKNPTWVYEQSAFFLSTAFKSTNKNLWRKVVFPLFFSDSLFQHLFESAIDSVQVEMEQLRNQSKMYEDEQRYFDKSEHVSKVFHEISTF